MMPQPNQFDTQARTRLVSIVLLALLVGSIASCSSDHGQVAPTFEKTDPADPVPLAIAPGKATEYAVSSTDTLYSDAPGCNALVKRIANEMLPCLQRIKPEMAVQLQTTIDTFGSSSRLRLDPANRDEVLKEVEENCAEYWRQIQHQLDSKEPEGQCLLNAAN